MLQPRVPVPLIASKGFRYNRRDIAIDAPFEAVSPQDADILVKARLARRPPPPPPEVQSRDEAQERAAPASTAADGGTRSPEVQAPGTDPASSARPPRTGRKRVTVPRNRNKTPPAIEP